jgi:hypothetical protein
MFNQSTKKYQCKNKNKFAFNNIIIVSYRAKKLNQLRRMQKKKGLGLSHDGRDGGLKIKKYSSVYFFIIGLRFLWFKITRGFGFGFGGACPTLSHTTGALTYSPFFVPCRRAFHSILFFRSHHQGCGFDRKKYLFVD